MTANKHTPVEFRYYEIPNGENVLALLGSSWIREYSVDENGKNILTNHFHNLLEIGICRWGKGKLVFDDEEMPYSDGTVVIIPKNFPHNTINIPGEKSFWEYIYINPSDFLTRVYESANRDIKKYLDNIEKRPIKKQAEEIPLFVNEVNCLMDQIRMQEYGYRNCIKGLVYTILMEIIKINYEDLAQKKAPIIRSNQAKIKQALDFVDEHYSEDIKIADLAEAAFISETYLRRLFSEYYNMSPLQYVNLVRIEAACKLLKKEDYNIYEVAHKVGFDNMSTFIKNFKKMVGETPKQWTKKGMLNYGKMIDYKITAQKGWN